MSRQRHTIMTRARRRVAAKCWQFRRTLADLLALRSLAACCFWRLVCWVWVYFAGGIFFPALKPKLPFLKRPNAHLYWAFFYYLRRASQKHTTSTSNACIHAQEFVIDSSKNSFQLEAFKRQIVTPEGRETAR